MYSVLFYFIMKGEIQFLISMNLFVFQKFLLNCNK